MGMSQPDALHVCTESASSLVHMNAFILVATSISTGVLFSLAPSILLFENLGLFLFTAAVVSTLFGNMWALLLSFYVRTGGYRLQRLRERAERVAAKAQSETDVEKRRKLDKQEKEFTTEIKLAPEKIETEAAAALGVTIQVLVSAASNLVMVMMLPLVTEISHAEETPVILTAGPHEITTGMATLLSMGIFYVLWVSIWGLMPAFRRAYYLGFEFLGMKDFLSIAPAVMALLFWPGLVLSNTSVSVSLKGNTPDVLLQIAGSILTSFRTDTSLFVAFVLTPLGFLILLWGMISGYRQFVYPILMIPYRRGDLRKTLRSAAKKRDGATVAFVLCIIASILIFLFVAYWH
jgi:hypothetical protein